MAYLPSFLYSLTLLRVVDDTVEALAKFVDEFPQSITSDPELKSIFPTLVKNLVTLCMSGTAKQAENAALILAKTEQTQECQYLLKVQISLSFLYSCTHFTHLLSSDNCRLAGS